ncbi:hypothetical protein FOMPIDRAFT_90087 [Fomitopsis schrenkii]|uniref:Uncharacterized protein n=1 Tax=Fomitopsis schrenkii TaxID=2126942 RepID=S8F877_FOMSC|nr:hypothetical protein FOMPIDRAFT_90087 [Fomitopsis schrenkii]
MNSLTHLSLDISPADPPPSLGAEPLTFLHLQTLIVSGCLAPMVLFFQRCSTPALTTLTIKANPHASFETTPKDFMRCLEVVSQKAESRDLFRHFILHHQASPFRESLASLSPLQALADVISPLCTLRQMETVDLSLPLHWGLFPTHASIEEIVASWPNLRTLRVDLGRNPIIGALPLSWNLLLTV